MLTGTYPDPEFFSAGHATDLPVITAQWGVYLRCHGTTGQYEGEYGRTWLMPWAKCFAKLLQEGFAVYAFFNNTDEAVPSSAVSDAMTLAACVKERLETPL